MAKGKIHMQVQMKLLRVSVLVAAMLIFMSITVALAQSPPPITYERYDVTFDIQADGSFLVREIQQIRFDGEFHTAFADIPLALTAGIDDIQIYEGDTPYAFNPVEVSPGAYTISQEYDAIYVSWGYTPTVPGDVRTFVLEYKVDGGLWVYPQEQILEWRAVPAERSGIVVESSTVTVTLPTPVAVEQLNYTAYGPDFQATTTDTGVIFQADGPIPDGVQFQVQVGFPPDLTATQLQDWQRREDTAALVYHLPSLDVDVTVEADGTLWVEEYHHVAVGAGALDRGYRQIPYRFLDSIGNISLFEGEQAFSADSSTCDYCVQVQSTARQPDWARYDRETRSPVIDDASAGHSDITWWFPPLVRGEETTLRLRYQVQGAIQVLTDAQQLNWTAVYPDRAERVETASVRLHLPPGIEPGNVQIDGEGGAVRTQGDGSILITSPGHIPAERRWGIKVTMPPDATRAAKPAWQQDLERVASEAQQAEIRLARLRLGFGVTTLLILALGLPGVYLLWYTLGRDQPTPAIADYLSEPPSDLPPGIVAYLLEEKPTPKGALASLFHLANLGLLWIRLQDSLALKRIHKPELTADSTIRTPTGETVRPPNHLVILFNALREVMPAGEEVSLYKIEPKFQAVLPRVYQEMGAQASKFFDELPQQARHRWLVIGQWIVLAALGLAVVLGLIFVADLGWVAIAPAVPLSGVGVAIMIVSRWMARRTNQGVEEANRWRAFRTYLQNLKEYGNLEQVQRILDRHFAYAVALDVEEVVLEHAEALGGHIPAWSYAPEWWHNTPAEHSSQRGREKQSTSRPTTPSSPSPPPTVVSTPGHEDAPALPSGSGRPSLSGLSRALGNTLSQASSDLGSYLSLAAGDTDDQTPFRSLREGAGAVAQGAGNVASSTLDVIGDILEESSSGGGSGGWSGSSGSSSSGSSQRWSSSSSRSSSSSSSSGRSSDSRRSAGGGRRGFG